MTSDTSDENQASVTDPELCEIADFLKPSTRRDLKSSVLNQLLGVSASDQSDAGALFERLEFKLSDALVAGLLDGSTTPTDLALYLGILTNATACSSSVSDRLANESGVVSLLNKSICENANNSRIADHSARLLANLSRQSPLAVHRNLTETDEDYIAKLMDTVLSSESECATSVGYTLVNLSQIPAVRFRVANEDHLMKLVSLLPTCASSSVQEKRQRAHVAADVVRNLAFEDDLHDQLLRDDREEDLLTALVTPLADANDQLDDDETGRLPIGLQYYDGARTQDETLRIKLVEALYQLCATRHGRERLRARGVYYVLRELDKSLEASRPKSTAVFRAPSDSSHTLHALIGVLIRHEHEMDVDPSLKSIRHLE